MEKPNVQALLELLNAKDRIIEQQQEQIVLLQELAEQSRLAFLHQSKELAKHRQFDIVSKDRWGYFWWLLLNNIWPFSIWYHRFDGGAL
jgi:hypothetical protein